MVEGLAEPPMVGNGFTDTETVAVFTQPVALVPVTVYVVEVVGVAFTLTPVVALNVAEGVHVYALAPLPIKVVLVPAHIGEDVTFAETVGKGFIVTEIVDEP